MWERYCREVSVIIFVVDSADKKKFSPAEKELKKLLSKPALNHIPLLVLLNKNDLSNAQHQDAIVKALKLEEIKNRDVSFYSISCKSQNNINKTLQWILSKAGT